MTLQEARQREKEAKAAARKAKKEAAETVAPEARCSFGIKFDCRTERRTDLSKI